ncbi:hypothetical protein HY971_04785 [Candidatus Kaiserbacteria bacterium]|nr:hypothetical protein [Candidatus Kaiserbacteria bacterium]
MEPIQDNEGDIIQREVEGFLRDYIDRDSVVEGEKMTDDALVGRSLGVEVAQDDGNPERSHVQITFSRDSGEKSGMQVGSGTRLEAVAYANTLKRELRKRGKLAE